MEAFAGLADNQPRKNKIIVFFSRT